MGRGWEEREGEKKQKRESDPRSSRFFLFLFNSSKICSKFNLFLRATSLARKALHPKGFGLRGSKVPLS